jgi:hypothetical protein
MSSKEESIVWLQKHTTTYHGMGKVIEDFDEVGKLGQRFTSVDKLEEVNLGDEYKA